MQHLVEEEEEVGVGGEGGCGRGGDWNKRRGVMMSHPAVPGGDRRPAQTQCVCVCVSVCSCLASVNASTVLDGKVGIEGGKGQELGGWG